MTSINIAVCQSSPWTGDFNRNLDQIKTQYMSALEQGADIALFAEGALQGYWAKDLYKKDSFIKDCQNTLTQLITFTQGKSTVLIIGLPTPISDADKSINMPEIYNSVVVIENGKILGMRHKQSLPNESACEDSRFFHPAPSQDILEIKGVKFGLPICNDIWVDGICADLKKRGAQILLTSNASPFAYGKYKIRREMAQRQTQSTGLPLVYVNDTGGYDSVLSEGLSFATNHDGTIIMQAPAFETNISMVHFTKQGDRYIASSDHMTPIADFHSTIWTACTYGLKQYVQKNGFKGVILGLSGGIDSAITCAMAVDALGADNVHTIMMPSPYTSQESLDDAKQCADALGVKYDIVNIESAMQAFDTIFAPLMVGTTADTTEENIQARIRGNIIMAMSNKFGYLALTTGNKSENAVGYATLYGDMCGGLNLIKDIYKTDVFNLCTWRNAQSGGEVIPKNIISKPPTAELRDNQKDEDSLPPYDILDSMLKCMLEQDQDIEQIVAQGFDADTVKRIWWLVHLAEYKRKQSSTGLKLTTCDFENDRKYPISNSYTAFASNKQKDIK